MMAGFRGFIQLLLPPALCSWFGLSIIVLTSYGEEGDGMDSIWSSAVIQLDYCLRILFAGVLGASIGFERMNRHKDAGVRTHAIIALASALLMIISKYGFGDIQEYDASRVAAQIVSGVGFLGAGIIFVRNTSINGLTTAAGMWATAGVGMAMGAGLWVIAFFSTMFVLVIEYLFHKIGRFNEHPSGQKLVIVMQNESGAKDVLENWLDQEDIETETMEIEKQGEDLRIHLVVTFSEAKTGESSVLKLLENPQVRSVKEEY